MKNLFARITHFLFGWKWVVLEDFDGVISLRHVIWVGPVPTAWRMFPFVHRVTLLPEYKTPAGDYVVRWYPFLPGDGSWHPCCQMDDK